MKTTFYKFNETIILGLLLLFCHAGAFGQAQPIFPPDGYAQNATGGGATTAIVVNSAGELRAAVNNNNAKVVIVNGRFDLGGNINIGSNTTLVGATTNSGLYNGTVKIGGSNYIIQNLTLGPASDDVMEISGATNVFITKCTFHDSSDELCSVVRQADFVTISWCHFYFDNPDSHSFVHLIGNGDGVTADEGKLHVTLHHNWYDYGIRGRIPRVRFGYVHVYNNYFNATQTGYAIGTGFKCNVKVENCHFDNTPNLWKDHGGISNGRIGWSGLLVEGGNIPTFMPNTYPVFNLPYNYTLDNVNDVETKARTCAGNVVCGSADCNGVVGGSAYLDDCNECVGGNTGKQACYLDCAGVRDGSATIDACGECTGGNTGVTSSCTGVLQGEDYCNAIGVFEDKNEGFVGSGYVNFDNQTGSSGLWTIVSQSAGTYTIGIRYANGGGAARGMSVAVNGSNAGNFVANPTGDWTTWATEDITMTLTPGVNTLEMIATTADGGPNVDLIAFDNEALSAGSCSEDCNGTFGGTAYLDNCNACVGGTTGLEACTQDCEGNWGGTAVLGNCGTCTGGNTGLIECTASIQAEDACLYDGTVDSDNLGFQGEGFVNTPNEIGASITLSINADVAKNALIGFIYANGGDTDRSATVILNGNAVGTLTFGTTGDWEVWQPESMSLNLMQGANIIQLIATTTGGIPNLDQLNLYDTGLSVGGCTTDCNGDLGGTATTDVCGKCIGGNTGQTSDDADADSTPDCEDECPNDGNKTTPGNCGCGNTEQSCLDCAGIPNGDAFYDNCDNCVGSQQQACTQDCYGDWGGVAGEDACGTCAGGNTGIEPVTDPQGCIATGVDEHLADFKVYPNPTDGMVYLDKSTNWKLRDVQGILLLEGTSSKLDLYGLTQGVYFLIIDDKVIKVVKK